jgi:putative ABC transport system permease protein
MAKACYALHLAWRGMRRHPRTSVMVVAVMALGLAACMSVLAIFHALTADPVPGRSGQTQTIIFPAKGQKLESIEALMPVGPVQQVVDRLPDLPVAAVASGTTRVRPSSDPSRKSESDTAVMFATARIPKVFGISLLRGHWWTAADDRNGAPVAVIGIDTARRLFGTDDVLGKSIRLDKKRFRVIGVHAAWRPALKFYSQRGGQYARDMAGVMVPLLSGDGVDVQMYGMSCPLSQLTDKWKQCRFSQLWSYGLDAGQRQRFLSVATQVVQDFYKPPPGVTPIAYQSRLLNVREWLILQHTVPDSVRAYVWVALAFLALCLLNAAGVLAARFLRRGAELGVRRALGASRRDVFVQHLIESGSLSMVAGVIALPLMLGAFSLMRAQNIPYGDLIRFNVSTFLALCVATLVTGLAVGVYPAWRAAVVPPALQVKQN